MHAILTKAGSPERRFDLVPLASGYEWREGDTAIARAPGRMVAGTILRGALGMLDDAPSPMISDLGQRLDGYLGIHRPTQQQPEDLGYLQIYWASESA